MGKTQDTDTLASLARGVAALHIPPYGGCHLMTANFCGHSKVGDRHVSWVLYFAQSCGLTLNPVKQYPACVLSMTAHISKPFCVCVNTCLESCPCVLKGFCFSAQLQMIMPELANIFLVALGLSRVHARDWRWCGNQMGLCWMHVVVMHLVTSPTDSPANTLAFNVLHISRCVGLQALDRLVHFDFIHRAVYHTHSHLNWS